MKTFKIITGIVLMSIFSLTSCQSEVDDVQGQNPNTNSSNSTAANNLKRTSMYDGSFDDFLDGASCSSIVLPATATVNGTKITLLSQLDYQQVINILGRFNDDQDTVVLQFPLKVKLSNYTEVSVANQSEYNSAVLNACNEAESQGKAAISCVNIKFPITILTYSLSLEQTGSIAIQSEQQLYTYINNMSNTELFSVKYPMTVTTNSNSTITVTSDAQFQTIINECVAKEKAEDQAEDNSKKLGKILVDGKFKVESHITAGAEYANNYKDYTIDFANDWSVKAVHAVNSTVNGVYEISSQTDVFLRLNFTGNASFSLLNDKWKVTAFNASSVTLQSSTNAAVKLVLKQI